MCSNRFQLLISVFSKTKKHFFLTHFLFQHTPDKPKTRSRPSSLIGVPEVLAVINKDKDGGLLAPGSKPKSSSRLNMFVWLLLEYCLNIFRIFKAYYSIITGRIVQFVAVSTLLKLTKILSIQVFLRLKALKQNFKTLHLDVFRFCKFRRTIIYGRIFFF